MRGYSLVKLIRATGSDADSPAFSYEILVHPMKGDSRVDLDVKDNDKNRDYCKGLKMRGNKRFAVRYLNTYSWTIISEERYEELLLEWDK